MYAYIVGMLEEELIGRLLFLVLLPALWDMIKFAMKTSVLILCFTFDQSTFSPINQIIRALISQMEVVWSDNNLSGFVLTQSIYHMYVLGFPTVPKKDWISR